MNSVKSVFVVAVLAAVAYGVYATITRNPELIKAPDTAPAWPGTKVQIPGPGAVAPQFPTGENGLTTLAGGGTAPQFSPGPIVTSGGSPAATPYPSKVSTAVSTGVVLPSTQTPSPETRSHNKFAAFMRAVQKKLDEGHLAEAHLALSSLYGNPDLPVEQAQQVTDLLDQLAGTVIYSRRHLLEPPYKVKPGDTIEQIAETYNVPWQLLASINGIRDPQQLQPGQELKIARGPFNARIELSRHELTLMLGGRYAGRFGIGVGLDHANLEGSYVVCSRVVNPQYYGPDGVQIDARDPNNPYGGFWIGLGERIGQEGRIGIHGANDPRNLHQTGGRGSICLGDQDIKDIFGILSIGSKVVIR